MPKNAETHIQNTAPGPPVSMAETTPTMLPVPTVPEMAVENASNCETEFTLLSFSFFLPRLLSVGIIVVLSDSPKCLTCKNLVLMLSIRPVPRIRIITGQPHTMPFMTLFTFSITAKILSNIKYPSRPRKKEKSAVSR